MSERNSRDTLPGDKEDIVGAHSDEDMEWLRLARDGFQASTDFLDDGIRSEWIDAMSRFHSQHPPGSKYNSAFYAKRSKTFRPKTRSAARRAEALAAKALFSNSDLINCTGQNKGSAIQAAGARVNKALLQYRLEHSIPWFITAMGARQNCFNQGVCVSLQTWKYEVEEEEELVPLIDEAGLPVTDEEGNELGEAIVHTKVIHDEPVIQLVPTENLRIDPNSDWTDPVGTSPAITVMMMMYVDDIMQKMKKANPVTGEPEWRPYSKAEILGSMQDDDTSESVRKARQGTKRQDPMDTVAHNAFSPVWVHLNIIRRDGKDYGFYTLSNRLMLSDPAAIETILPLGRKSITVGTSIVEAHRIYPAGGNALGAPIQYEINDVANQRLDNVKLALNKRFILRRGANIDTAAMMRSVPGGGVVADDPEKDIKVMEYRDVTGSSYQEQDRLAQEQDELVGMFSGSSVQANRSLNETVGGMNLLQGDAASVAEYELRTWIETWVEPVLRKLQKLEAMFETDAVVMEIAGENSEVFQRYGRDAAIDELIDQEVFISVNVGMGNTDPMQKIQRFQGILSVAGSVPEIAQRMNGEEIGKELFSMGGYSDGERFFLTEDQMMQRQQGQQKPDNSLEAAKLRAEALLKQEEIRSQDRRYEADLRSQTEMEKKAAELNIKLKDLYERIGIDKAKLQTQRDTTALIEGNKAAEQRLKKEMGSGI